jgi:hypothetical protein
LCGEENAVWVETRGSWTKEESSRDDGALWVCLLKGHGEGHVQVELCRVESSRRKL